MKPSNHYASNSASKSSDWALRKPVVRTGSGRNSCLEKLEDRTLFSTYVVNVLGDPAVVPTNHYSLRTALEAANSHSGSSTIDFSSTVFNTDKTIDLQSQLVVSNPAAKITIVGPSAMVTLNEDSTALYVKTGASLVVERMNITSDPGSYGGYSVNDSGYLSMINCTVSAPNNTGGLGGIYNRGTLSLQEVTIANHGDGNSGIAFGAGLNNTGTANLKDVTFQYDDAGVAGAIGQSGGTLNAVNVTIYTCGSDTNARGGAVAINAGKASFTNGTVDNSFLNTESTPANALGAAIYVKSGNVTLINDTITHSAVYPLGYGMPGDVPTAGAIYISSAGKLTMGNTVVSGLSEEGGGVLGTGPEIVGHVTSLGHNLIGQTSSLTTGLVSSDLHGTHASPLNPELNALAHNGGYTETETPKFGSVLINAGNNSLIPAGITTDQRGNNRILNGTVDIGAVEVAELIIKPFPIAVNVFKG